MKIELRPIEGVLTIKSDVGHKAELKQGTSKCLGVLKEGKVKLPLSGFKNGGMELQLLDESGEVVNSKVLVNTKAFDVDPRIEKRNGSYFLDLRATRPLNTLQALKIGFKASPKSSSPDLVFSNQFTNIMANSETFELKKLIEFDGGGKLIVQALTRIGEKFIKVIDVHI